MELFNLVAQRVGDAMGLDGRVGERASAEVDRILAGRAV
jgi:hypothetical protein